MADLTEEHGGNIYKAALKTGLSPFAILDFSANINPLGLPPGLPAYLTENLEAILHYPDPEYEELYQALSKYLDVEEDLIVVGNGAAALIYDFLRVLKPKRVLIPAPSFGEYQKAAYAAGAEVELFLSEEKDAFRPEIEKLCTILNEQKYDALVLGNPNNPTGQLLGREELIALLDCAKKNDVGVLLDEAFIEFTSTYPFNSLADTVKRYSNLCIVRAFTKFFGMPGLRLGYGIMDKKIKEKILRVKPPWEVNSLAALAGAYALKDEEFRQKTRELVRQERQFLQKELQKLSWIKVYKSEANFMLLKLEDEALTVQRLQEKLLPHGILIRDASNFEGLNESYARIAVKDNESNRRLLQALKDVGQR